VTSTDAFGLKNSNLNAFLFADVGVELNGSALTILSILARLGEDPWAEAARWAGMPKAVAIDCLAQRIGKMQLNPQALADTSATASRLVLLLPLQTRAPEQSTRGTSSAPTLRECVPIALLCLSLMAGILFNVISGPVSTAAATVPVVQHSASIQSNQDPRVAAKPPVVPHVVPGL